jgi:hypothetical protein
MPQLTTFFLRKGVSKWVMLPAFRLLRAALWLVIASFTAICRVALAMSFSHGFSTTKRLFLCRTMQMEGLKVDALEGVLEDPNTSREDLIMAAAQLGRREGRAEGRAEGLVERQLNAASAADGL